MTIELNVTNLTREGLVAFSSMVISTKMIGPAGISGSMPWMLITKELLEITRIYLNYFKLGSKPLY